MPIGLVGRKCGMTRIFTELGDSVPVTVIEALPNRVTMIRTDERDGYRAIQVTAGQARAARLTKSERGHFEASGVDAGSFLCEFRLAEGEAQDVENGTEFRVDLFESGQLVDVVGLSKGKGYAGTVKRHNFRTQDTTHGNSLSHRAPGSIGQNQSPGRVFKGKKMAGRMGGERTTVQNLEVVRVDPERNLILVKGAVPGAASGRLLVQPAVKSN